MKFVTVAEMVTIEKEADAKGHSYAKMMEHAGYELAKSVNDTFGVIPEKKALGLIGSGNNGGDTLVAFTYLQEWDWTTTAYIVGDRNDDPLIRRAQDLGCEVIYIQDDQEYKLLSSLLMGNTVLLDGLLGTGIHLPLRGRIKEVLEWVKTRLHSLESPPHVVAVDCPSGMDCNTGEIAPESIRAELTVTMAAYKQGILKFPAFNFVGELKCVGIGLPDTLESLKVVHREVVSKEWVKQVLPERPLDAHKGTFGVVLVVAGSINYSGAAILSGEAAFRSGAGWVTLAVPEPLHNALAGTFIEATWLPLPHKDGWISQDAAGVVINNLDRVSVMLVGPGFGLNSETGRFLKDLLQNTTESLPPVVIDADGLKLMAGIQEWFKYLPTPAVLTPHPGEMSVITGIPLATIQADRQGIAEKFARLWGHVVVLKGAFTVIASPDGRTNIIPVATPALARAGTGDVLAGLITGLRAQGMEAYEAASAGAWIHAKAGIIAGQKLGSTATVLAGDVLKAVNPVFASF